MLALFTVASVRAQVSPQISVRVHEGRAALIQMRLQEADSLLSGIGASPQEEALLAYHRTYVPLLGILLSDKEDSYTSFFERSDSARAFLDDQSNTGWYRWLAGEIELQRTWAWAKQGKYFRAALAANAAFFHLNAARKLSPEMEDIDKGLGLIHLAIGTLPDRYRRLLRFLGYSGTLREGLAELHRASLESEWNREEALILMATVDKYGYPSVIKAANAYERLWNEYRPSPLIALLYADALIRERRPSDALAVVAEGQKSAEKPGISAVDYLWYFQGEAQFRLGRCAEAVQAFQKYDNSHAGPSLKLAAYLMAAQCEEISGNRDEALTWYKKISGSRGFAEESAAVRSAARYLKSPMTTDQKDLLRAQNLFNSSRDAEAQAVYESVLERLNVSADQKAEATYGLARVFHENGRMERALKFYGRTIASDADSLKKWRPFSMMHAASIYAQTGRRRLALRMLERLDDYSGDYDFKSSVENRARLIRDELDKR